MLNTIVLNQPDIDRLTARRDELSMLPPILENIIDFLFSMILSGNT
tara:strand:- start:907 stop:1044 length:138 start_codon:yes stop_codon:yes gene_type:complete